MLDPVFSPFSQGYLRGEACGLLLVEELGCHIAQLTHADIAVEIYRSSFINRCISSAQYNPVLLQQSAFGHIKFNAWGEQQQGYCFNDDLWFSEPKNLPQRLGAFERQVYNQHGSVVPYYLLSLASPPLACDISPDKKQCERTNSLALSAAMPTAQVLALAVGPGSVTAEGRKLCYHQWDDGGRTLNSSTVTLDPGDDYFYLDLCDHLTI
jgi:hypothetical protein